MALITNCNVKHSSIMSSFVFFLTSVWISLTDGNVIAEKYHKVTAQGDLTPSVTVVLTTIVTNATECCFLCTSNAECEVVTYNEDTRKCELMSKPWIRLTFEEEPTRTYFAKDFGIFQSVVPETTWMVAKTKCEEKGGRLLQLDAQEKIDYWNNMVAPSVFISWIGLTDIEHEGVFKWTNGSELNVLPQWSGGKPSNTYGNEHCVNIRDSFWNDVRCNDMYPYTCELF